MWYLADWPSPLGQLCAVSDGAALTALWFADQKKHPPVPAGCVSGGALPVFEAAQQWLERYFQGEAPGPIPPVTPVGTAFQASVWGWLRDIPHGQTVTYGTLSARFSAPMSAQAVGGAVGRNPIAILIPCHRVVGAGGALTGYAGGLWRKEALLRLEGSLT